MNRKSLAILEYDKIKHKLFQHATTEMGKRQVKRLSPSTDLDEIQVKLLQTKRWRRYFAPKRWGTNPTVNVDHRSS